jgi:hypothetical protein
MGFDVNHPPPYDVKVKNEWIYTSALPVRLLSVKRETRTSLRKNMMLILRSMQNTQNIVIFTLRLVISEVTTRLISNLQYRKVNKKVHSVVL